MTTEEQYLEEAEKHIATTNSRLLLNSLSGETAFKRGYIAGRRASAEEVEKLKRENKQMFDRINDLEDQIIEAGLDETQNP